MDVTMLDAVTENQMERLLVSGSPGTNCLQFSCEPGGEPVVSIDLDTGEVTLYKPVSEASRLFWDAVGELVFSKARD